MVTKTTIEEYNIPKNTCVIVSYNNTQYYIVLWNYNQQSKREFFSPYVNINNTLRDLNGSFRLHHECVFERYATKEEIKLLQDYLDEKRIDFKIKPLQQSYELW